MSGPSNDDRPPLAVAMQWVSRVTTISLEMVLPGIAGHWLDNRWGTSYLALLGLALGLTIGLRQLIAMSREAPGPRDFGNKDKDSNRSDAK